METAAFYADATICAGKKRSKIISRPSRAKRHPCVVPADLCVPADPRIAVDLRIVVDLRIAADTRIAVDPRIAADLCIAVDPCASVLIEIVFRLNPAAEVASLHIVKRDQRSDSMQRMSEMHYSFVCKFIFPH